jgi:hypothetical protein
MNQTLILFTRNPEMGKGKRRLAARVGDQAAYDIYCFLLEHTLEITKELNVEKQVWYSEEVPEKDIWPESLYEKKQQSGADLGARMELALKEALKNGGKAIVIGSDLYDIATADLQTAFDKLDHYDAVIGPAQDGGYYLIGFKDHIPPGVFENKDWGTNTVLQETLADLKNINYFQLPERNDVDYYEDIKDIDAFQPFLKHIHAN